MITTRSPMGPVTVTVAPGTTAPVVSTIVPLIPPFVEMSWATAGPTRASAVSRISRLNSLCFISLIAP